MTDDLVLDAVVDVRWAALSTDGLYRYVLGRRWNDNGRRVVWLMLNPSIADAEIDDQTVRRCLWFSRRDGFGELVVVNLFALRATDPAELDRVEDPVGPENMSWLGRHLDPIENTVVCAWGAHPWATRLAAEILDFDDEAGFHCYGRTADGSPRHPSRLPKTARLEPYRLD